MSTPPLIVLPMTTGASCSSDSLVIPATEGSDARGNLS